MTIYVLCKTIILNLFLITVLGSVSDSISEGNNSKTLNCLYLAHRVVDGKYILTSDMLCKENTEYIIKSNYDLNGKLITIPRGCVLKFDGGSFSNGAIFGHKTDIRAKGIVFRDISIDGTFNQLDVNWFSDRDEKIFSYCINNSMSSIVDFKGHQFSFGNMCSITRENVTIKNAKILLNSFVFRALEVSKDNVTIDNIYFEGNFNCVRAVTFSNSECSSFINSTIKNVGNKSLEVAIGLELKAPCDYFHMNNCIVDNVTAKNNASGVSVAFSVIDDVAHYPKFCKFRNSVISNITSLTDADGIKILQIKQGGHFQHDATVGHHLFEDLFFENCTKRALKLQCQDVVCRNISCEGRIGAQAIIDYFGDNIYLDGLYLKNIEHDNAFTAAIFTHDYKTAVLKNIYCIGCNNVVDSRNALVYDTSTIENSTISITNVESDYNVLLRNEGSATGKTLLIENVNHTAGYHFFIMGNSYTSVYLKNVHIDKSKLERYWFNTFNTLPTEKLVSDLIINMPESEDPIMGMSDYSYEIVAKLQKPLYVKVRNNKKTVIIQDSSAYPDKHKFLSFDVGDVIESPMVIMTCLHPISDELPYGIWSVKIKNKINQNSIEYFYDRSDIYVLKFD